MKKISFPHRRQMDAKDCGAACIQMIAKFYGKNYPLQTLREYSFISREGSSLMGVSDAAEQIGFRTTGLRTSLQKLKNDVQLPCILHWNQNHYVVCYRIKKQHKRNVFFIANPATSLAHYTEDEFKSHWIGTKQNGEERGIVLTLQPKTEFYENKEEITSKTHTLKHYFRYLYPYKWQIGQTILSMFLFMILGLIFPFLTQALVDTGIRNNNINFVILILVSQFILTFTNLSVGFFQGWISLHVNTRINISLVSDFWTKLMKLPIRFFDTKMTGDLIQRLEDHARIENFLVGDSVNILFSIISFLLYSCLLGYYNITILIMFLSGHFLYVGWIFCFLKLRRQLDYKAFEILSKNRSNVVQLIQGMQEIKLNSDEKRKRWEWEQIQIKLFKNNIRGLKINQIQNFGATFITQSTGLLVSFLVAKQVIEGEMTFGMMMALSYIIGQVGGPISQFVGFIHSFQNAQISFERLNEIHGQKDEDEEITALRNTLPEEKDIHLKGINFSYNGSRRSLVLKDINLDIPKNKITAIVGVSGSGKTTVMKLLQGFYEPIEGELKVGHVPLNLINPHLWRQKIGAVMQDGYIFSDTIARNIAVGVDEIDKKKLQKAVEMANIKEFIDNLPLGFNTHIGMEGNGISQGQRQRILIARAVYKDPDYLFFDEATNALDSNNEKVIMKNLAEFYKGKTVVIAAHRLSTIKSADQVVVLKEGRVAECGTHDELMIKQGEYYHLVENQLEKINK